MLFYLHKIQPKLCLHILYAGHAIPIYAGQALTLYDGQANVGQPSLGQPFILSFISILTLPGVIPPTQLRHPI
jgi:hypothetical protein